ncbi:MAG: hypothetical protein P8H38_07280 [Flavobacteriaceae bacterium]|nr:hypothetical protein [Flavobacteriaceae bacterium]
MKNNILITLLFVFSSLTLMAQNEEIKTEVEDSVKVKRFSIGLKLGIPNLASGYAELVLPTLNNHFAPYIDYSKIPLNFDEIETNIAYTEYGVNYYFNKKGSGFFVGVGKGSLLTDITFNDLQFSDSTTTLTGSGSTKLNLDTTNFKIGLRTQGTIFFRLELGYGMGTIPDVLNFTSTLNGITETFVEDIPPIPGLGTEGILLGNIGFGVSF